MIVNEYVESKRSKIHRRGLFARCDIPKGTPIIEYVGEKITKAESARRADDKINKAKRNGSGAVYIFELNQRYDIDGNVTWNPARLINHACDTNCESAIIRGHVWIIATRKIKKGEELFYDYGYSMDNWQDHPCHCNKPGCVGYIVAKRVRWRVRKKLEAMGKKL